MDPNARHQHFGSRDWNSAAALNQIDKSSEIPTIKEGRITKAVAANPRESYASNIHTLFVDQSEDSDLHNTYLDYDHSKRLPSQALQDGSRKKFNTGIKLGSNDNNFPNASHQTVSCASRVAAPPFRDSKPASYAISYNASSKSSNKTKPRDPFQALAQSVESSSGLTPHLRAPSLTSLRDVQGSKSSSSLLPHKLAPSSVAPSAALPHATQVRSFISQMSLDHTYSERTDALDSPSPGIAMKE